MIILPIIEIFAYAFNYLSAVFWLMFLGGMVYKIIRG